MYNFAVIHDQTDSLLSAVNIFSDHNKSLPFSGRFFAVDIVFSAFCNQSILVLIYVTLQMHILRISTLNSQNYTL